MTATRALPKISTDPGGVDGTVYSDAVSASVAALWDLSGGVLKNVAGTNSITATIDIPTGFSALGNGQRFTLIPVNSSTGPCDIDIAGIGIKPLVDQDGTALGSAALIAGRAAPIEFFATSDHFRLIGGGGTSNVTITGGLQLQRSAPARAVADVAATTALSALVSVNMQMQANANRVIIEGNVSRLVGAGAQDTTGTVIALYVDGVSVETFTDWCEPAQFMSTPFAFEYLPGDTSSHAFQIRASSTVAATYPAGSNFMVATEMSPNS